MGHLSGLTRVLFLHAHPDDETLATGALIAELVAEGADVAVLTATRGERGDVVRGAVAQDRGLGDHRAEERAAALAVLGVRSSAFLGDPPALGAGRPRRRYLDSGMVWVTPEVAGPAPHAGPDALTAAPLVEAAADAAAYLEWFRAQAVVSYDAFGGYGHPDHVACHQIAVAAARRAGVRCLEIVSQPHLASAGPTAQSYDLPHRLPTVRDALTRYASQLTVEGDEVVHVGGQREAIQTSVTLRPVRDGRAR